MLIDLGLSFVITKYHLTKFDESTLKNTYPN